ncbi:MAG: STAS domain-containing protein [Ideonella sp.]
MTIDSLPARLTHREAPDVARSLAAALDAVPNAEPRPAGSGWPIDASQLKHFDSSALAVLLECRRVADAKGLKVQVTNAPAKLARLASLYGLEDLLVLDGVAGRADQA